MAPCDVDSVMSDESVFGPGDDYFLNAIVHYEADQQWHQYACGFKESADQLVDLCVKAVFLPNLAVMPVCFLYRHALEIYLKFLLVRGNRLLDRQYRVRPGHELRPYWDELKPLLLELFPDHPEELEIVERTVEDCDRIDPRSLKFRYPVNTAGNPTVHDYGLVNLSRLRQGVSRAFAVLEGYAAWLHDQELARGDLWLNAGTVNRGC